MYAHRKNIIQSYEKLDDEFVLHKQENVEYGAKGDYVATNLDGDQLIIPEELIAEYKKIDVKPDNNFKKYDSPFVTEYVKELQNSEQLEQREQDEYIEGKQEGWAYKQD